ncbi:MAG TPA: cytochrome c maturation protein CcmE [Iamia sp.]|nr:cytochrome c maturation protein CcmE [Iamia sp.]
MSDAPLDLSPRTGPDDGATPRPPRSRGRGLLIGAVILALLGGIVALLIVQVQGSSLYYYNVDEAVAQRESLGDRDIRIQGTVVGEPTEVGGDALVFDLAFGGESVAVRHLGPEPPPLFDAGVPSVLEGHFADDGAFVSERIVIKHSEEYREDNPEHVEDAPT